MKFLPCALVAVISSGATVFLYDRLRPVDTSIRTEPAPVELGDIEARLAALEAGRRPLLEARAVRRDPQPGARGMSPVRPPSPPRPEPEAPREADEALEGPEGEIRPEHVERFRKLREAVVAGEQRKKVRRRVEGALDGLGLVLSEAQQRRVVDEVATFDARRAEIWAEVKTAHRGEDVDWPRVLADTNARILRELAGRLEDVLPLADAEAIAANLYGDRGK